MKQPSSKGNVVFGTPWFEVFTLTPRGFSQPYYAIHAPDFVVMVAVTQTGQLMLVRQFRPALDRVTLELPAGLVEPGETPEQTARKELCEETGYEADAFELLGTLSPSTARLTNRMWVFFVQDARPAAKPEFSREADVKLALHAGGIRTLLDSEDFVAASSCAALLMAVVRGKIQI
jgi:ADP-ribose pyrophosphatase